MQKKNTQDDIALEAHGLTVCFGSEKALENVSFSIKKGAFVGLIGPNGAGKSTLLRVFLGLIKPTDGFARYAPDLTVRYVPQQYALPTHVPISVAEVVQMGSQDKVGHSDIVRVLTEVGLQKEFAKKNYHTLSGGQKQRVIIARALIVRPDVMFFDEPLSGVDLDTKMHIYKFLKELNRSGMTIFFVSHDIDHVVDTCDYVLCLDASLHKGCHPVAFARGQREIEEKESKCLVEERSEKSPQSIHHHHKQR